MAAHRIRHQLEAAVAAAAAALVQVMLQQLKQPLPMTINEIVDHMAPVCKRKKRIKLKADTGNAIILNFTLFTKTK